MAKHEADEDTENREAALAAALRITERDLRRTGITQAEIDRIKREATR